mmetsp:Transcript_44868/g.97769  ORF Transcript_44868/g.97769 Transcript_44868/m.97769 type:complete len:456 (-) Transcript_44868:36-1403(-)
MAFSWAFSGAAKCCAEKEGESWPARPRLRIGTTPGLRDEPVNVALARKRYDAMSTAMVEWVQCPTDLDAVTAMMKVGLVDIAMMHAEEAVWQTTLYNSLRVCGCFNGVPRRWILLVPHGVDARPECLRWCRLGIPCGLTGKLMSSILEGALDLSSAPPLKVPFESLSDALQAMLRNSGLHAVFWEATEVPPDARKLCTLVKAIEVPWATHLLVATRETVRFKLNTIRHFIDFTGDLCNKILLDRTFMSLYLYEKYRMLPEEADAWMGLARCSCQCEPPPTALAQPLELLRRLELVPMGSEWRPSRLLAQGFMVASESGVAPRPERGGSAVDDDCGAVVCSSPCCEDEELESEVSEGAVHMPTPSGDHHLMSNREAGFHPAHLIAAFPALGSPAGHPGDDSQGGDLAQLKSRGPTAAARASSGLSSAAPAAVADSDSSGPASSARPGSEHSPVPAG